MLLSSVLFIPAIILYIICLLSYLLKKKLSFDRLIIVTLSFIFLVFIISFSIFPIPIHDNIINAENRFIATNNLIPFKTILSEVILNGFEYKEITTYFICSNLIILFPIGYLLPLLKNNYNIKIILLYLTSLSLTLELSKLIIGVIVGVNYRGFDIDRIILNIIGGLIGFLLLKFSYPAIKYFFEDTYIDLF